MFRLMVLAGLFATSGLGGTLPQAPPIPLQIEVPRAPRAVDMVDPLSTHPIVGVWRWENDPEHPNTHVSYGVFHADGTYEEVTTGAGTAVGLWAATGERTVAVTYVFQDLSDDPDVLEPGATIIALTAEVDASGNRVQAEFRYQATQLDGTLLDQGGPFAAEGARFTAEAFGITGNVLAATPIG